MAIGPAHDVLRQLRAAALARDDGGMTDGQLLESFVTRRDDAAFEALVRRHGAMVLGVCRRVLRQPQDVEDAFQATFLVLVRKASSVGTPELLGNWLYGVAYRTALAARSANLRRQARERQVSPMPEPEAGDGPDLDRELRPLLDRELDRLPAKYRVPVVLCDLEGRTLRDVARQLDIPTGTLSGRLAAARRRLARQLTRRGLALSAAALTSALSPPGVASAGVPAPLLSTTVETAMSVATGQAATAVSAEVAALTEGVLRAMFITKLKTAAAVFLAAGCLLAAGWFAAGTAAEDPAGPRVFPLNARGRRVLWSPDGKTLAVVTKVEKTVFGVQYDSRGSAVRLWDVEKGAVRQTLAENREKGLAFQHMTFSADGKAVAATVTEMVRLPNTLMFRDLVKVWDPQTGALRQTLETTSSLAQIALTPDGQRLAAADSSKKKILLWDTKTGLPERTLDTGGARPGSLAFSPDGKTLVVSAQKADGSGELTVWEVATGERRQTLNPPQLIGPVNFAPDGKRIAAGDGGGTVQVWDVAKGDLTVSLKGNAPWPAVAFAPDGTLVAVGGRDGKIRLWELPAGALKATLAGHKDAVYSVAFSPDGKTLASVSQDETLRLWPIRPRAAGAK